jgi:hypothetical protein
VSDQRYARTVEALVAALDRIGSVDPEDGCMPLFYRSSKRKAEHGPNCYWTPAKHVAELLVNELGIEFFGERGKGER